MASLYSVFYGALSFLTLAAAIAAVIISIVARKKYPKRATYAAIGFGLFAVAGLLSLVWPLLTGALLRGPDSISTYQAVSLVFNALRTLIDIGAIAMLVLALVRSDESAPPAGQQYQGQQQYPGQSQYPGQPQQYDQYPSQQPYQQQPGQPPQQYPNQPPGQQYPYQQPPQQYPGQGY